MTDKNVKKTKEDFGYIEELKDFYFQTNTSSQKGSFHVQKRKKDYYWYFLLSSGDGKKRFKYLCKTFEGVNSNGETSFQHCLNLIDLLLGLHNCRHNLHLLKLRSYLEPFLRCSR